MKPTTEMVLTDNLKALNLSHMLRQLEPQLRQAREQSLDYGDFLLSLTDIELEGRAENRLKRRLRGWRPLTIMPPLVSTDVCCINWPPGNISAGIATSSFWARAARAKPIWPQVWAWRPAVKGSPLALSPAVA